MFKKDLNDKQALMLLMICSALIGGRRVDCERECDNIVSNTSRLADEILREDA